MKKMLCLSMLAMMILGLQFAQADIIWVSELRDNDADTVQDDQGWVDLLTGAGYTVDVRLGHWQELDPGKIAELDAADLVIISRGAGSGGHSDGDEPLQWNSLNAPMINLTSFLARSNRWDWIDSTTTVKPNAPATESLDPGHPIFAGVPLDASNMVQALDASVGSGLISILDTVSVGNGVILANADGLPQIVEWNAGTEYYSGSAFTPSHNRMFFAAGTQETPGTVMAAMNLTPNGQTLFLNAVDYMINNNAVIIPDPGLNEVVRNIVGIPVPTPIYSADMLGLVNLNAFNKGIEDLTGLEHASNLEELNLFFNKLTAIPEWLFPFTPNLRKVSLDWNQIAEIPGNAFVGLGNLRELRMGRNQISVIAGTAFAGLTSLRELQLNGNAINTMPPLIDLPNLQRLHLNGNQIGVIPPDAFLGVTNLQSLNLGGNQFTEFPIVGLSGVSATLQELHLMWNPISTLPADLSAFLTLRTFSPGSAFSAVPAAELASLPNLRELDLPGNPFGAIPAGAFVGLAPVEQLNLSETGLTEIPGAALADLPNLNRLEIRDNRITEIPSDTFLLQPLLSHLNLQNNRIDTLHANSFAGPASWREITLYENQINDVLPLTSVPGEVFDARLDLRRNPLNAEAYSTHIPTLEGQFDRVRYESQETKTLSVSSTSGGSVVAPGEGNFVYARYQRVPLSAVAEVDNDFVEWDGNAGGKLDDPGAPNTSVYLDKDLQVEAVFESTNAIIFPDPGLEQAIRDALGIPVGSITSGDMLSLNWLYASGYGIFDLTGLEHATNLGYADLGANNIGIIQKDILGQLQNLSGLDLYDNLLIGLPAEAFPPLPNLIWLNVSFNPLGGTIDENAFANLPGLREIALADTGLISFPIDPLVGLDLTWLELGHNPIGVLPDNMAALWPNLEGIALQNIQINTFPTVALSGLADLGWLYLDDNGITELPAGMSTLWPNLRVLNLSWNPLGQIPAGQFAGLGNLRRLNLEGSQISTIAADALGGLTELDWLNLNNNQLSAIPSGLFTDLTNLAELELFQNAISVLAPDAFTGLAQLEVLNLERNQLSVLPGGLFAGLANLHKVEMQNNQISDLSPVQGIVVRDRLDFRGNPLNQEAHTTHLPIIEGNNPGAQVLYDPFEQWTLTTSSTAGGAVTAPGEGAYVYTGNTQVPLVASAAAGYYFVQWTGMNQWQVSNRFASNTTVTLQDNCTLEAQFAPLSESHTLAFSSTGNGSVTASGMELKLWRGALTGNLDDAVAIVTGSSPNEVEALDELAYWDRGDNYVAAVEGWLVAPGTGDYTFYIYGDDHCGLFLSPDASAANINTEPVCQVDGWANEGQWDKYPSQTSVPVALIAGQRYAFRAVHREGGGGDGMGVAWSGPGVGTARTLITDDDVIKGPGTYPFASGTVVSVNASPAVNHRFIGWTGTAVTAGQVADPAAMSTTVTVTGDHSLQGNFVLNQYPLTTSSTVGGTVTVPGEGTTNYAFGATVNLVAVPDPHHPFVGWTGPVADPTSLSTSVIITGPTVVGAMFTIDRHTLTVSSESGGSVTAPGEGIFTYDYGTSVPVVATPRERAHFLRWTGSAVTAGLVADPDSASTTVTTNADHTLVATFTSFQANSRPVLGSDITATSAILRGRVLDDVGVANCKYNFKYYKKSEGFTHSISTPEQSLTTVNGSGDFAQLVEGLEPGCTYVYQALARNSKGNDVGQLLEFTTLAAPTTVELTVLESLGGQVLVPGVGTHEYERDEVVPVTALADEGSFFLQWVGSAVDAGKVADALAADTTVVMDESYSLQPEFVENSGVLYVDGGAAANGALNGTIGSSLVTMAVTVPDGTIFNPFMTIQEAISAAVDGDTVVVLPGLYTESLNFMGKAIEVTSLAQADPDILDIRATLFPSEEPNSLGAIDATIIDGNDQAPVVVFETGEDANTILTGFTVTGGLADSGGAIQVTSSGPTITHCVIVGNAVTSPTGGAISTIQGTSTFINCTIADNSSQDVPGPAVSCIDSNDVFANCILWGSDSQIVVVSGNDPIVGYCNIQGMIWPGLGNTSADPCFVLSGGAGDYHLQSAAGCYDPNETDPNAPAWVVAPVTSPCIDLGDPASGFDAETAPNGDRINMGAYGGTKDASRSVVQAPIEFVSVSDSGFTGQMARHEITNGQYCEYLTAALGQGVISVSNDRVYAATDANYTTAYFDTAGYSASSQIVHVGGTFSVLTRDGHDMSNHPVVCVSWYGAQAFCDYYGYRLPTEGEWQAVADYDGSYAFGCGVGIEPSKANYLDFNPLGLSSEPYTAPVGHYGSFGYGLCEMAGNVSEWTASATDGSRVTRGGNWTSPFRDCTVTTPLLYSPNSASGSIGFRVCR